MYILFFISKIYIYTQINRNFKKIGKSNVNRLLLESTPNGYSQHSWSP